jgi:hypothetical protein
MAAVGSHPFHYSNYYMDRYNSPHGQGSGSGSDSRPASSSYSMPLGDAQSDQLAPPFDLSEYILLEPGAVMPLPLMQSGTISAPLVQGAMSTPQMENAVFQAAQSSVAINVPTSSGDTR